MGVYFVLYPTARARRGARQVYNEVRRQLNNLWKTDKDGWYELIEAVSTAGV